MGRFTNVLLEAFLGRFYGGRGVNLWLMDSFGGGAVLGVVIPKTASNFSKFMLTLESQCMQAVWRGGFFNVETSF